MGLSPDLSPQTLPLVWFPSLFLCSLRSVSTFGLAAVGGATNLSAEILPGSLRAGLIIVIACIHVDQRAFPGLRQRELIGLSHVVVGL